jgi:putative membrane protein
MSALTNLFAEWISDMASDLSPVVLPVLGILLVAFLYWRGARYEARTGIGRPIKPLHILAFTCGLLVGVLAVASPLDVLADGSLAWHMVQHELLVLIAAPLIVFGAALWPLWRAFPVTWRRVTLRWLFRRNWAKRLGESLITLIGHPIGAWVLFVGTFSVWHVPVLYDLALENEAIHGFEHLTFLVTAIVFWAQVIPSFPIQPGLSYLRRGGYLFAGALALHLLSVLISIAAQPIYPFYGTGSEALASQTAAGAIMDVSGQVVFTIAILSCVWLWLRDDERRSEAQGERVPGTQISPPAMSASGMLLLAEADLVEPSSPSSES